MEKTPALSQFQKIIRNYYDQNARKMPWRETRDPYRILVSEVMLQQTQASRVEGFYKNFIKQFPNFGVLARAKTSDVLRAWQGLGYNRRALSLQRLAGIVTENYNGHLPNDAESLIALPGIGKYTAGAICAFAFNKPEIFIETNIRRVFIHFFFSGKVKTSEVVTDDMLYRYIEWTVDRKNPREWYYALMDYGAMLGESARAKKSAIGRNPNRRSAGYVRQAKFAGSDREIRGKILRMLILTGEIPAKKIYRLLQDDKNENSMERAKKILAKLIKEGFIIKKSSGFRIIS